MTSGHSNSSSHRRGGGGSTSEQGEEEEIVCNACGFEASFVPEGMIPCERCQKVNYCSVHCLQWDWKSGGHSSVCVDIRPSSMEEEDDSTASGNSDKQQQVELLSDSSSKAEEEMSLISMDVNHLFDGSIHQTTPSIASVDSSSATSGHNTNNSSGGGGGGGEASNQRQSTVEPLYEKQKASPPSLLNTTSSDQRNKTNGGGGLKLGTFFESQKKQQASSRPPPLLLASSPNPIRDDDDDYDDENDEELLEEVEEDVEILSDSIDLVSSTGPDNLKSIVEESEVTGDEPDLEGSWRSRDPFVAPLSPYSPNPNTAVVVEEDTEQDDDNDKQDSFQHQSSTNNDDEIEIDDDVDDEEVIMEDVTETEVVEESYESTTEDPSYDVMEVEEEEDDDIQEEESSDVVVESPSSSRSSSSRSRKHNVEEADTLQAMKDRSYGSARGVNKYGMPLRDAVPSDQRRNSSSSSGSSSSSSSDGVNALMEEYGYDSNFDGDSSETGSTGSLEAEANGDTTRTEDTTRLAAQPATESDPTQIKRLMVEDESTEDDDDDFLFDRAARPTSQLVKPSDIGSLYTIASKDFDSSITTDDQSSLAAAGQASKEASSSGTSTGQVSHEEPSSMLDREKVEVNAPSLRSRKAEISLAVAPPAPTAVMNRRGSEPSTSSSSAAHRQNAESSPFADVAQRRHSGPRSASALLDFRTIYSGDASSAAAGATKDHAQALKDFRLAYQADSTPPTTPASTSPSSPSVQKVTNSPGPSPVAESNHAANDDDAPESLEPSSDLKSPGQNNALTVSINKAIRDYETLYGADAAQTVVMQLTRGAMLEEDPSQCDPAKNSLVSDAILNPSPSFSAAAEPIVVATVRVQEHGDNSPTTISSSFSRESNPNTPPVSNGYILHATSQIPSESAETGSTPADSGSRPRYLAYRHHLARGVTTPKESSEKSSESTGEREYDIVLDEGSSTAVPSSGTVSNQDSSSTESSEGSTEVPQAANSGHLSYDIAGPSSEAEMVFMTPAQSSTVSSSETPRYLAYRTQLLQSSIRTLNDEMMDAQYSNASRDPVHQESDTRSTPFDESGETDHDTSREVPADEVTPPGVMNSAPSSESLYQSYRSHLASSAAATTALIPISSGDDQEGSTAALEDDTLSRAIAANSVPRQSMDSQPRYISYRESMARRVAQTPQASTEDPSLDNLNVSRSDGDDADDAEVEQRLSSYLHKGMIGATATTGVAVGESELVDNSGSRQASLSSLGGDEAAAAAVPAQRYIPEPLRSKRAASALALAQEAQRQRSQLKPLNGQIEKGDASRTPSFVAPKSSSFKKVPPAEIDRDLEAGEVPREDLSPENADEQSMGKIRESRVRRIVLLVVLVAIVVLVVGLSVGLANRNRVSSSVSTDHMSNDTSPANPSPTPSTSTPQSHTTPTAAPSGTANAPPMTGSSSNLLALLTAASFDEGASIQENGSPQNEAFSWLANSTDLASYTSEQKIQRYALATLYFSTDGENWRSSKGWLSDNDECDWFSRSSSVCDSLGAYTDLSLGFNDLGGTLPPELALLSSLTSIALSGSTNGKLSGTIPVEYSTLSSMKFFSIRDNKLEGPLSDVLDGWSSLQFLDVGLNQLSGTFPTVLSRRTDIREIDLSENRFDGTIPDIGTLTKLSRLSVSENRFTGALDGSLSDLTSLRFLNIQMNRLTSLPSSIGLLTSLEVFEAYQNNVTGELFTEFGELSRLRVLDLHSNEISGQIPSEISLLSNLRYLDLSSNAFDGEIPTDMGLMVNLIDLLLQSNTLKGTIPTELSGLTRLSQIRIDDNSITGTVPDDVCKVFSQTLPTFYLDCGGSSPEVTCPPGTCCTYCCESDSKTNTDTCTCLYEGTGFDFLCR